MSSFSSIQLSKSEKLIFIVLLLLGLILRFSILDASFSYDEMYTVKTYFLHHSWWGALAKYNLPNNHFLNTLFGHVSLNFFPLNHYSVRFFPFLFGVLFIPLTFFVSNHLLKEKNHALFLMGVVACGFPFIQYSGMARGYIFQCFFTLLLIYSCSKEVKFSGQGRVWSIAISFTLAVFSLPFSFILFPICLAGFRTKKEKIDYFFIQFALFAIFLFLPSLYVLSGKLKYNFNYTIEEYYFYLRDIVFHFYEDLGAIFLIFFVLAISKVMGNFKRNLYFIFTPLCMMILLQWFPPFFRNYLFFIIPIILLAILQGEALSFSSQWYIAIIIFLLANSIYNIKTRVLAPGRNYRKAYEYLSSQIKPGDLVAGFYSPLQSILFYEKFNKGEKKYISIFRNKKANIFLLEGKNTENFEKRFVLEQDRALFLINDHSNRRKSVLKQLDFKDLRKVGEFKLGLNHYGREVTVEKYSDVFKVAQD